MVLSTLFGDRRARLAGSNYGNFVVFQVSFKFLLFLSYFIKPLRDHLSHLPLGRPPRGLTVF